jgi:hypothetical protein
MYLRLVPIAAGLFAAICTMPLLANDNLAGEYLGTVQKVEGSYRAEPGAPCRFRIEKSEKYGGSLSFAINDEPPMLFETRNVAVAEAEDSTEIKLSTANTGERLKLKTRKDGSPVFVLMMRVSSKQHTKDLLTCEGLQRK